MSILTNLHKAKHSFYKTRTLTSEQKSSALLSFADLILKNKDMLLKANAKDLKKQKNVLSDSLYSRLKLDSDKLEVLADGIREIAHFEDPVDKIISKMKLDDNLILEKVSVPLGVIGVIFESRPDVIPQILSLILKTGNVALLKGGTEAIHSNKAFMKLVSLLNKQHSFLPSHWAQLFLDRKSVHEMLKYPEYVSLIIPRGSNRLVQSIMKSTKIPVLGHADGICHVYVNESANLSKALKIVVDAKTQYPSACNTMETLLVDSKIAPVFLPMVKDAFDKRNVEIFGDKLTKKVLKNVKLAKKWNIEYGDLKCSIRIVDNVAEAIEHINTHGSHHTDAIISDDLSAQILFKNEVDSACVMVNASTRFADGYRFGMGAEVGISTNKTHARGPVGIEGLIIYKYVLAGNGQIVSDYSGNNSKKFKHERLL